MVVFSLLHVVITLIYSGGLLKWVGTPDFKDFIRNPLKNSAILAPLVSLLMTMNLFIGPIRYFVSALSANFQSLFLPAFSIWFVLFMTALLLEVKLLKTSFEEGFNISEMHFGWLLRPFLLSMLSTVGTGIAAMSKDSSIANAAAFLSMVSFTAGIFLFIVQLVILFKNYLTAHGLPESSSQPSFLIVIPNITLFAISAFRFGHFLERHHSFHVGAYFYIVLGLAFAFEIWYLVFGLSVLRGYFKKSHFKEFYVTQWGLICPLVAFAVLGSFVYNVVLQSPIIYGGILIAAGSAIAFYFELMYKQFRYYRK